jgi:hypothetical protein
MEFSAQELIGYLASLLVVVSLSMTSVVRLRMISLAGSVAFVVYASLIGSVPIVVTNIAIACLNIWFLWRELSGGRDLGAIIVPPDSPFLLDFLHHHADEIEGFQPDSDPSERATFAMVLTRDGLPAGVVLGERDGSTLDITIDFVVRAYRDSRLGRWLYGPGARVFKPAGIDRITATATSDAHRSYLDRVGFVYDDTRQRYTRQL